MDMLLLVLSLVLLTQLLGWLTASGLPTTVGWREGSNDGGDFRPKPLPVDVEHQVENGTSVTKTMYDDGFPSPLHRTAQFLYYIRYCIQTIWRVNNTSSGNAVLLLLLLAHRHTCPHRLCMSGFSCVSVITLCEMKMVKESGAAKKKKEKGCASILVKVLRGTKDARIPAREHSPRDHHLKVLRHAAPLFVSECLCLPTNSHRPYFVNALDHAASCAHGAHQSVYSSTAFRTAHFSKEFTSEKEM